MKSNAKWTYMVYMAGHNSLSPDVDTDLEEMRQVGSSPDVNVLVQFDKGSDEGSKRFCVQCGGTNEEVEDLGKIDSGDPNVLLDFVTWSHDKYPANHYVLVLWNHGGGWQPDYFDTISQQVKTKNWNINEESLRLAPKLEYVFFSTTIQKILSHDTSNSRAICIDNGSHHSIDTKELGNVLARTKEKLGQKLDILGMDACLMADIEVAYQAEPYVKYIVSSEDNEPAAGWKYSAILDVLKKNPDISVPEFSCEMVKNYKESYEQGKDNVTQSAFDLSRVKDAANSLDLLAKSLIPHMPNVNKFIGYATSASKCFCDKSEYDVSHFCKELSNLAQDNDVKQAAQNVIKKFEVDLKNFIIAEAHIGEEYDMCCGASVYLVRSNEVSKYYADLEIAKDYKNWLSMLEKYKYYQ